MLYSSATTRRSSGTLNSLGDLHAIHVVMPPQLHGAQHRDRPYLEGLARRLNDHVSWEVLPEEMSSDDQQRRFAAADLVLAGRYHPAVFAIGTGRPLVALAYEHKTTGLMEEAGLGDLVLSSDTITAPELEKLVHDVFVHRDRVGTRVRAAREELVARSARTNRLVDEALGTP
ncbi:MAG: polysaccharide pyruvyl transferase family protein [Acidimicrobiia bacterium]|nr:polysaccharide pyruvyl transferase family protein [Acidimicrobiia bacterium]